MVCSNRGKSDEWGDELIADILYVWSRLVRVSLIRCDSRANTFEILYFDHCICRKTNDSTGALSRHISTQSALDDDRTISLALRRLCRDSLSRAKKGALRSRISHAWRNGDAWRARVKRQFFCCKHRSSPIWVWVWVCGLKIHLLHLGTHVNRGFNVYLGLFLCWRFGGVRWAR